MTTYHIPQNVILPAGGDASLKEAIKRRDFELARAINGMAEITWEDMRFPANAIDPVGSAAPATRDTTTGMLSFSGSSDNTIAGIAQLPHAWLKGSVLRPHLHLVFPTSNTGKNTRWKFEYNIANPNENFGSAYGSYSALPVITVANPAATAKHVLASFADLTMTGYRESTVILWRISRLANSDAADDDTNAAILLEFDIHFQRGKSGTLTEIPV